jgi:hypothetical protein
MTLRRRDELVPRGRPQALEPQALEQKRAVGRGLTSLVAAVLFY